MNPPQSQFLRTIIILYFIFIHVFLGIVLVKTDIIPRIQEKLGYQIKSPELTPHYFTMLSFHLRIDKNISDNSVVFIGDSITQGLAVSSVAPISVNFGIGHDTTFGVLERIPFYTSVSRARAVVLAIGVNDLNKRDNKEIIKNFENIFAAIPHNVPILISTILPVNEVFRKTPGVNARILKINAKLAQQCAQNRQLYCLNIQPLLIDSNGNLSNEFNIGDGIHLNEAGYQIWIAKLKEALLRITSS